MDELVGLVTERIAAQIRKLRELAIGPTPDPAAGPINPAPAGAMPPGIRVIMPAGTPQPRPQPQARSAAPPRQARVNLDDAFPTTLGAAPAGRPMPATALLAAFGGGASLLGAIVLTEALAPPVALRHEPPHPI